MSSKRQNDASNDGMITHVEYVAVLQTVVVELDENADMRKNRMGDIASHKRAYDRVMRGCGLHRTYGPGPVVLGRQTPPCCVIVEPATVAPP